jgi:hypothetical protein
MKPPDSLVTLAQGPWARGQDALTLTLHSCCLHKIPGTWLRDEAISRHLHKRNRVLSAVPPKQNGRQAFTNEDKN